MPTARKSFYNKYLDKPYELLRKRLSENSTSTIRYICRENRDFYRGHSKFKGDELISFIINQLRSIKDLNGKVPKLVYNNLKNKLEINFVNLGEHVDYKMSDFIDDGSDV